MANYTQPQDFAVDAPPKAQDVLAGIFEKHRKKSDIIPPRPYDAAHWWMDHQEPPKEPGERMEQITTSGGKTGWRTPYIDRVVASLRVFLGFNDPQRAFVIDKVKRGIPWRGDSIQSFAKICEETEKMDNGREGYISAAEQTFEQLRKQGVI